MKFLLILTLTVLLVAEACAEPSDGSTSEKINQKENFRSKFVHEIQRNTRGGIERMLGPHYPITPEQIVFGNEKLEEFVACSNATVDIFLDKFDDNVNFDDIETLAQAAGLFAGPVCEIFDDIFRCVSEFNPVIDMFLVEPDKVFKNKIFTIVPLIQQSVCLRNGEVFAQIFEHVDGESCLKQTMDGMIDIGITELFNSESEDLFGDETVCRNFNNLLKEVYSKIGECSLRVLKFVKDMLGFFCEGTKCERFIDDLQCY